MALAPAAAPAWRNGTLVHDDGAFVTLSAGFRGQLIQEGDAAYEEARRVWNSMIDKRPALIARCTGTQDIVAAVRYARASGLAVAVRGGGHNVAGSAVNDGGLVIDLSLMKDIEVDPIGRTVRAEPGVTWGEMDQATQQYGLVTPGGVVSSTGIAGFTLAGGMAFTSRKWGLACDNLLAVDLVTADGQVLRASGSEHPDLFWAIRGGGGNFGIVTSFEYRLHPLGPEVSLAVAIYALEDAAQVAHGWRSFVESAPDEITCLLSFWGIPAERGFPEEMHGAPVVIATGFFAGPPAAGEAALQPLRQLATPIADLSGTTTYLQAQSTYDPFFPTTQRYYWKSLFLDALSDDEIAATIALAAERPSPKTLLALRHLGGAISQVPEDATAYANRGAQYNLSLDTTWDNPNDDEQMIAWTRRAWQQLRDRTGGGVYLNFAGLGEENDQLAKAGHGANYDRLRNVKRRYDPENIFQGNINIVP